MGKGSAKVLDELVRLVGSDADTSLQSALTDEHARWRLYKEALCQDRGRALVLEALQFDEELAPPTAVLALELVDPAERFAWLEVVPQGRSRDFAERRAIELGVLERLTSGSDVEFDSSELANWSQWLQLRLAEAATAPVLLDGLASEGTTRRVRGTARERLHRLSKAKFDTPRSLSTGSTPTTATADRPRPPPSCPQPPGW